MKNITAFDIAIHAAVVLVAMTCFFPFIYVFSVSFTDPAVYVPYEFYIIPRRFSLEVYKSILATDTFVTSLTNTVYVTFMSTIISIFATFTFAYGLTKKKMPFHGFCTAIVIFALLFDAGMIPNYMNIRALGLINSFWALILPGMMVSWNVIIARNFIAAIPAELEEAATIDGASYFGVFFRIILPLSTAVIATLTLFIAVGNWNQYVKPLLYISDFRKRTIQVYLKSLLVDSDTAGIGPVDTDAVIPSETIRLATVVLAMLPIMCVYPFVQRYFVKGVMVGSVKG